MYHQYYRKLSRRFFVLDLLITSTSMPSRSDNVPDAFKVGGGGSIAAIFFLFLDAKKLPKKPPFASFIESRVGLFVRTGVDDAAPQLVYQSWDQLELVLKMRAAH